MSGWLRTGSILVVAGVGLFGCAGSEPRGTVTGRVTLAGQPLPGVALNFEATQGGASILVDVDTDGTYTVKTYKGGGLLPGPYRVAVRPAAPQNNPDQPPLATDAPKKSGPLAFPARYLDARTSGLRIEVQEGNNPPFDFNLDKN